MGLVDEAPGDERFFTMRGDIYFAKYICEARTQATPDCDAESSLHDTSIRRHGVKRPDGLGASPGVNAWQGGVAARADRAHGLG